MTTDNATDARNRWTEWPPVPRPTTNGAAGLAEWAAGKPAPSFKRCVCGVAIHPDYSQCEACEYNECPNCGEHNVPSGWDAVKGFCTRCTDNGDKDAVIAGSERWVTRYGYYAKPAVEITPDDVPHVTVCGTCGIAISARRSLCNFCQAVQS